MKKVSFLASFILSAVLVLSTALCSAQDSIQYQLVIRNAAGKLITNKQVNMKFSLVNGGQSFYEETQKTTTDKYGNISVFIGTGTAIKGSMKDVPWSTMDISLKVESDTDGGDKFKELGTVPIAAAPYAMFAATAGSNANGGSPKDSEALFEVCDRDGQPVFAVYNSGIVVYVDESAPKAKRSGLVVTGRSSKDGESADYFAVDAEGTHIYVDDTETNKAARSGLIVTGRAASKSNTAGNKHKSDERIASTGESIFAVSGGLTTVYVDDTDNAKAARSGFVVTGRTASKDDKKAIEITGTRTDIKTGTLSISNNSANDEIAEAPAAALQLSDKSIDFQNDIVIGGGVRPAAVVKKTDEYTIYLSDEDKSFGPGDKDSPVEYDYRNLSGYFKFDMYAVFGSDGAREEEFCAQYNRLAAFHDDLVVPMSSDNAVLLLNSNNEETAILKDAVVAVLLDYHSSWYYVNVWPLKELHDFDVNFAIANYSQTTRFVGSASEHARFNVTLNSSEPFAGCDLELSATDPCKIKATTKFDERESEIGREKMMVQTVYGETATLEVTEMPEGRIFNYWLCNGQRYYGNPLSLPVSAINTNVKAVFKDLSPIVWVDYKNGSDTEGDGTSAKPLYSIAKALTAIKTDSCQSDIANNIKRSFRINVKKAYSVPLIIDNDFDGLAERIFVDYRPNAYTDTSATPKISVLTSVPVIVTGCKLDPGYTPTGDAAILVDAEGARLTFENEEFGDYDRDYRIRFATVNKGELVLNGTNVYGFIANIGGGVLVENGAKLTLKGNSSIYAMANSKGGGVYLKSGATLDIVSGWIEGEFTEGSTNTAGAGVYAEAGSNFYVSANAIVSGVALANGAIVTAVGDFTSTESPRVEPGGDPYWEERMPVVTFDSIANPEAAVAQLGNGTDPDRAADIFSRFEISSEYLLYDLGYQRQIGPKGYLVKSNMVYSTGSFKLIYGVRDETEVNYVYYRNETNDEYLHLMCNYNSIYEYHNYYLVDGEIYSDSAYCKINGEDGTLQSFKNNLPNNFSWQNEWDNYKTDRPEGSYGNLLAIPENNYQTATENGVTYYYEEQNGDNPKVYFHAKQGVLRAITDAGFFKNNFAPLKSLIESAVCIKGRDKTINNFESLNWTPGFTISGLNVSQDNIRELESGADDNRKFTLNYIEKMFDGFRNGFRVRFITYGGGKIKVGDKEFRGTINLDYDDGKNTVLCDYFQTIPIEAIPDEGYIFKYWNDGHKETNRNVCVEDNNTYLSATFQPAFYVSDKAGDLQTGSEEHPFATLQQAIDAISNRYTEYIVFVDGVIKGNTVISDKKVNIIGKTGVDTDVLDGNKNGAVLVINGSASVKVENLKVTGGTNSGIRVSDNSTYVTLENMLVEGNSSEELGGGVYSYYSYLTVGEGAVIQNNSSQQGVGGGLYATSGWTRVSIKGTITQNGTRGVYIDPYKDVLISGNAIVDTIFLNNNCSDHQLQIQIEDPIVNYSSEKPIIVEFETGGHIYYSSLKFIALYSIGSPTTTIANEYSKFAIMPTQYNGKIQEWHITEDGYPSKVDDYDDLGNLETAPTDASKIYAIINEKGLENLATWVNGGNNFNGFTFKLMRNVNLSSSFNVPIGTGNGDSGKPFAGTFDGDGRTISGLNATQPDYASLFENVTGTVKNLTVSGNASRCGIVYYLHGTIENCVNKVNVSSTDMNVGGVVCLMYSGSIIKNCINLGTITGHNYVGGIVAKMINPAIIDGCINYGEVYGVTYTTGGVVNSSYIVGGISGAAFKTIRNCVNKGNVTGTDIVGGIVGQSQYVDSDNIGIINCYNTGKVVGVSNVGGIEGSAGINGYNTVYNESVKNCYNAGEVNATNGAAGVIGQVDIETQTPDYIGKVFIENAFYLNTTANVGIGGTVPEEYVEGSTTPFGEDQLLTLLNSLNTWVDHNNTDNVYKTWKFGDDGYPEFAE